MKTGRINLFLLVVILMMAFTLSAVFDRSEAVRIIAESDFYKVLGVEKNASEGDIKKVYHKLSRDFHPDKLIGESKENQDLGAEAQKKINVAYETLSDEELRKMYDAGVQADGPDRSVEIIREAAESFKKLIKYLSQWPLEQGFPSDWVERRDAFLAPMRGTLAWLSYVLVIGKSFDDYPYKKGAPIEGMRVKKLREYEAELSKIKSESGNQENMRRAIAELLLSNEPISIGLFSLSLMHQPTQDFYINTFLELLNSYVKDNNKQAAVQKFNELKEIIKTYYGIRFKLSAENLKKINDFAQAAGIERVTTALDPAAMFEAFIKELAQIPAAGGIPSDLIEVKNKLLQDISTSKNKFMYEMLIDYMTGNVPANKTKSYEQFLDKTFGEYSRSLYAVSRKHGLIMKDVEKFLTQDPLLVYLAMIKPSFHDLYFEYWLKEVLVAWVDYGYKHKALSRYEKLRDIIQTYFSQRFKISQKNLNALNAFAKLISAQPITLEPLSKKSPMEGDLMGQLRNLEVELYALSRMVK